MRPWKTLSRRTVLNHVSLAVKQIPVHGGDGER